MPLITKAVTVYELTPEDIEESASWAEENGMCLTEIHVHPDALSAYNKLSHKDRIVVNEEIAHDLFSGQVFLRPDKELALDEVKMVIVSKAGVIV